MERDEKRWYGTGGNREGRDETGWGAMSRKEG
jgi:hypothetical protein